MKNKDQQLLEEAYLKIIGEDFNSERRLNAFSQNLKSRGFAQVYKEGSANGEIHVLYKAKTDNHRMSVGSKIQDTITQGMGGSSMVSSELIFVEVDASKNFVDGYVLTVDAGSGSKIVKHLTNSEQGFSNIKEMLDSLQAVDGEIRAREMHPLKSYEEVFQQINDRDRQHAEV